MEDLPFFFFALIVVIVDCNGIVLFGLSFLTRTPPIYIYTHWGRIETMKNKLSKTNQSTDSLCFNYHNHIRGVDTWQTWLTIDISKSLCAESIFVLRGKKTTNFRRTIFTEERRMNIGFVWQIVWLIQSLSRLKYFGWNRDHLLFSLLISCYIFITTI